MDILIEFIMDMYAELMLYVIPDRPGTTAKRRTIAAILAITMFVVDMALFLWGGTLLFDRKSVWGWVPILAAVVLSLAQIVLGFIVNHKKSKHGRKEQ